VAGQPDYDRDQAHAVIAAHASMRGALLPLLHAVQRAIGFVPDDLVPEIALALNISKADVHGVITFYHDFRRRPAGRHVVKICRAESCQARGGAAIEAEAAERLGVAMGETRADGKVTLEAIYCLGLCASGPSALVDGVPIARVDSARLLRIAEKVAA
jgi:formate dehydrogenase subunit gamma